MTGLTRFFDEPFFYSEVAESDEASLYPISLNGVGYLLDFMEGPTRTAMKVVQNRQSAYTSTPVDALLLPPEVWRRSRESWHQGDHQIAGDRQDSLPYRFNTSRGVNVWNKWQVSLLNDTTAKVSTPGATPWVSVVNGSLAVTDGTSLKWYASLGATVVPYTLPATILSSTQNGRAVYMALSNGTIYQSLPGATPTLFLSLANVSLVAYVKDFLLAVAGNVLNDVTTGTAVVVRTHPIPQFTWVDAAEGLSCIYLLGGVGDKWVVHRVNVQSTGAGLDPPIVAAMLPDGEIGYSLGSYMGYLFVGTDKGLRFGIPQSDGSLTLGPLITTTSPVRCFEGQGRYVWFGLTNIDATNTGLGRVDLTTFTENLAPASASDLMAPVQGNVTSVTTWLGYTVFAVAGQSVYIQSDNLVPSGYVIESDITFGIPDTKIAHYARLRSQVMVGDAHLDLQFDDSGQWIDAADISAAGSLDSGNSYLFGQQFGKAIARLRLNRSAVPTLGPTVTRWELRTEPVTGKGGEWNIPIIIADEVEVHGMMRSRNVDVDIATLVGLAETGVVVSYREGALAWQIHVVDYIFKPQRQSTVNNGFQGTLTLLAREVK
jgi:hypothetical protein